MCPSGATLRCPGGDRHLMDPWACIVSVDGDAGPGKQAEPLTERTDGK